ncbi:SDR family NAD(P)-dependent oxidoreductase [Antrihabitans spumae]|uniref:SDR family NAD(P)-dependent oxidoreductase n=1 Tax=Antrihabitans spumae TaxID=3373370 RepID=A0ABW7JJR4_9NOCA
MRKTLAGKRIAITGGARGIGRSTAEAFAAAGASVVIGDIDAAQVEKTAAAIAETSGAQVLGLALDVTDVSSFEAFLDTALKEFGELDALVNNAGIMPTGNFLDESIELADRQFAINTRGVIIGSKLAGRRFAERGSGHIVNVASILGLLSPPGAATYCATKHAVVGLGEALHQELEPLGVAVSTICPSFVNTELIDGLSPNWLARRIGFIEPGDVADSILDAVASGRGGQRIVPATTGLAAKLLFPLPEDLRNKISRLLGGHDTVANADIAKRRAYIESVELQRR